MQTDPTERLTELRTRLKDVEKRRADAEQNLRSHVIETKCYRNGFDQLTEDAQLEIGTRLVTEERRLLHEAIESWQQSVDVCQEACLVLADMKHILNQQFGGLLASVDQSQARLTDLRDRVAHLDSVFKV